MSLLAGRKFLIVGGNGYVGSRLAAKLIQNEANVSVLSR
jgi:nucleoside-diphosphate-sugar epimerase